MQEEIRCYASPRQRELLKTVAGTPLLRHFFLTGGTCLSVFYLHHRVSHDLDFFTTEEASLTDLVSSVTALLRPQRTLASTDYFFSCIVDGIKLDFVADSLSAKAPRESILVDDVQVKVDRLDNIGPNKICALVSRTEPRDVIDCYMLYKGSRDMFMEHYQIAMQREALLDDFMYVGEKFYHIGETARAIIESMKPDMRKEIQQEELSIFYNDLGERFSRIGSGSPSVEPPD